MGDPIIETEGLTKVYGRKTAVDNLDLNIERGEIFGLIGPNGSGKTTTILMLLGLTEPSSGRCRVMGLDPLRNPLEVKRLTGYLPERVGFYGNLTPVQNLTYLSRLNDLTEEESQERIDRALEVVGLEAEAGSEVESFSRGMKQRLAIASLLVKEPEIAFLDEPTMGLDPEGADEILELIVDLKRERDMTVMCSSHLLHQVRRISDRVGMMIDGRMVSQKKMVELEEEVSSTVVAEVSRVTEDLLEALREVPGVEGIERKGNSITVRGKGDLRGSLASRIVESGSDLLRLNRKGVELSEFYRRYSQEARRVDGSQ